MAYMKNSFETWIRAATRSNGTTYSEETISNYINALRVQAEKLTDISLVSTDLFTIDDADTFKRTVETIRGSQRFTEINQQYHRVFSSALNIYQKFLREEIQCGGSSKMNISFADWMKIYPDHKYTDATIKRYIRALQKAEEWLDIQLPKKVLDIVDLAEFTRVESMIKETSDFAEVNQSHGHGDLSAALSVYRKFLEANNNDLQESDIWWPVSHEYHPGIGKEKWLELLNTPAVFTDSALKMIAEFYVFGGVATCAQLSNHYKKTGNYYLMTSVHLAERVVKATGCPVVKDEKNAQNAKWWPVLYVGRKGDKDDQGTYTWKIRDELYEALGEFGIERYLIQDQSSIGGECKMTIKEKVTTIKAYIAARGFNYEGDLIENFYLSLKSKPFVILAGTSGTGKTRLVKLFAEAISAKMQLVPVRPDWSDSSDLFGHTDLSGNFHPGAIIDFIKQAEWDKSTPHFLCLDEMNLARVEYYLSDFLSIIETRDRQENGAIETDALVDASYFQSQSAREKYGRVYIPENLYIIGTVNMDETTFPFSKKVLDRANTIEFSFVNLMARVSAGGEPVTQKLDNRFLKTDYLYLQDCDDEDLIDTVCFNLEELNQILVKANLHVGYRVRNEISFYMMNNKNSELLDFDAAFDHEIMQKILPRVQGSSSAIKKVLSELFAKCAGDYSGFAGTSAYEQMDSYLESKTCKYPNSAKKIAFMMRRYEEDGFTSYWL